MAVKNKKLEILYIEDILRLNNEILSTRSNHYLRNFLFNLRVLFRHNDNDLDDFIDLYYLVENILKNNVLMDMDNLKCLIYRLTDLLVNLDDYDIGGQTLVSESISSLLHSLYLELETYRLVDKLDDDVWEPILLGQIKNQVVDFSLLLKILDLSDSADVRNLVLCILENNYPMEFAVYKARRNILDGVFFNGV